MVGTGPYKLKEYVQNDRIVLERFEEFHSGWDGAHFDEIVFRIVPENATRRALVEAGDGDATTFNLTPADVVAIEEAGELVVLRYPSTAVYWTGFNCAKLADVNLRKALCYAFPYEDVRDGVYEGLIVESSGPCTPNTLGYDPNGFIYRTDAELAKELLAQSGFDTSQTLTYMVDQDSETSKATAEVVQAAYADIGLRVEIIEQEGGSYLALMYGSAPAEERPDLFSWSWWPDYNDASNEIYPSFYGESFQTAEGPNVHFYVNERLDEIIDKVEEGVTEDEYLALMAEANNILTELDPPAAYYGAVQWYTVMQPNIRGFVWNGIYINTYNVYDMYRVE
jgi:peptide/nickel transport system substrate-binding protein